VCKNVDRRMAVYRRYVDKNYKELNKEYIFHGSFINVDNQLVTENYEIGKKYKSVFLIKKTTNFVI
jgi:hypothetical protein